MARSRRFLFAAPFVMVATLPACKHHTGDTTHNPPQPTAHYATWNVSMSGDTCYANDTGSMDCPEGASCNPPPPMSVECPAGITADASVIIYQDAEGGPCYLDGDGGETPCPSWGDEDGGGGDDDPVGDDEPVED